MKSISSWFVMYTGISIRVRISFTAPLLDHVLALFRQVLTHR